MPDAGISVPAVTGTMPDVSGDVSVPSAAGVDVDVAAPSVDVDSSLPSASIDLPGEYKASCICFSFFFFLLYSTRHDLGNFGSRPKA